MCREAGSLVSLRHNPRHVLIANSSELRRLITGRLPHVHLCGVPTRNVNADFLQIGVHRLIEYELRVQRSQRVGTYRVIVNSV